jgi:hypothetical protein
VPGSIYIFNDCVCFASKFNKNTFFGQKTKIRVEIKEIVICEVLNNFGTGILITTNDGVEYQFNNLGDDAKMTQYLI